MGTERRMEACPSGFSILIEASHWHRLVFDLPRRLGGSKSSKYIWLESTSSAHDHTQIAERESCPLCSVNIWTTSAVLSVLTAVSIQSSWPWLEGQCGSSVLPRSSGPPHHTHTHMQTFQRRVSATSEVGLFCVYSALYLAVNVHTTHIKVSLYVCDIWPGTVYEKYKSFDFDSLVLLHQDYWGRMI